FDKSLTRPYPCTLSSALHNRDRRLMIFFALMNELSLPPERAVPPAIALSVTSPVVTLTDGR
ncbi:hypothetical protein J6590_102772, partial [Homalodisca vitripennis]